MPLTSWRRPCRRPFVAVHRSQDRGRNTQRQRSALSVPFPHGVDHRRRTVRRLDAARNCVRLPCRAPHGHQHAAANASKEAQVVLLARDQRSCRTRDCVGAQHRAHRARGRHSGRGDDLAGVRPCAATDQAVSSARRGSTRWSSRAFLALANKNRSPDLCRAAHVSLIVRSARTSIDLYRSRMNVWVRDTLRTHIAAQACSSVLGGAPV
jgi:hypothetical protein